MSGEPNWTEDLGDGRFILHGDVTVGEPINLSKRLEDFDFNKAREDAGLPPTDIHDPLCALSGYPVPDKGCSNCFLLAKAEQRGYQRGRKEEQDYHAECECHRMGTWFEKNGTVEWCSFDGVQFVPESVALAEYQRGREDAAQDAERVLGAKHNELIDAILKCGYNCECQIGGADAMSLDTDWLWKYANSLFAAVVAARGDSVNASVPLSAETSP